VNAHRNAVLREMGLGPLWRLRAGAGADFVDAPLAPAIAEPRSGPASAGSIRDRWPPGPDVREAHEPSRIPVSAAAAVPAPEPVTDPDASFRTERISRLDWDALEADMRECTACRLCERRKQAVPGVGDRHADWMLVGEGPGAEEDQRGEPFVGAAGKLLDAMLAAIGLKRGEHVYIANAVKCRPPHNRTPESDEIATCFPYLARQIELVRPRLLVALGRPAAQALLKAEVSIGASRGKTFHYGETPVVITYHPAYLLRNQADKAKVWEDLCFARRIMRELPRR